MFNIVGRHSTFVMKIIFANIWFFSPLLNIITRKQGEKIYFSPSQIESNIIY